MFYLIDHSTMSIVEASENFSYLCDVMVDNSIMAASISRIDHLFDAFDAFAMLTVYEKLASTQWRGQLNREALVKASTELALLIKPRKKVPAFAVTPQEEPATKEKPRTGATAKVWEIATEHKSILEHGWPLFRARVLEECANAGINPATAQVQLSKWKHQNF
jgi:hypothetical protein